MSGPLTISQAHDIAEMAALQPQWQLSYQQLSAGPLLGQLAHVALAELNLTSETANRSLRQQGRLLQDNVGLALAESPAGPARYHGQLAGRDTAMVGPAKELDLLTPAGAQLLAIQMPTQAFRNLLWQLHPHAAAQLGESHRVMALGPHAAMHLRQLITQAFQTLSTTGPQHTQAAAARHMQDGIVLALQEALGDACAPEAFDAATLVQRRAVVSRCCEHAQDRLPEPTSLLALCQQVGVSARKLNHCFQEVLGMSPARYLRLMRLNGAHQDLLAHTRRGTRHTVVDIAGQWGFWHMGAFASDYRRLFGRLPSQAQQPPQAP